MSKLRQADEVQFGERRVLQDVLRRKDDHLANLLLDAIAAVLLGEEPRQPFGATRPGDAVRVNPDAGGVDGLR